MASKFKRIKGRAMSDEEFRELPVASLLNNLLKFVRRDYGGSDPAKISLMRAKQYSPDTEMFILSLDSDQQRLLGELLVHNEKHVGVSSRERMKRTVDELRRRYAPTEEHKTEEIERTLEAYMTGVDHRSPYVGA